LLRDQHNKIHSDTKEKDKLADITEILGLLEEKGKSKDWILAELKRHRVKLNTPTPNSAEILKSCPQGIVSHLLRVLKSDEFEDFEEIRTLTKTYHWFYTDIVASARPDITTKEQAHKIIALNGLIEKTETFKQRNPDATIIFPTGDGVYIGFADSPEKPLQLATQLHRSIYKYNTLRKDQDRLKIRTGIHTGPVYIFHDLNGKDNVWGDGIITARRVMDLGGPMHVLASKKIADDIRKLSPEYKRMMHKIGDYSIKHGEQLQIYNIYGDGFGNKNMPRIGKIQQLTVSEQDQQSKTTFEFSKIDVILEITNPKTMMTHHTWIWNIKNITESPKEHIFYYIGGDTPKDFSKLNVKVTDERRNKLKIVSLNVNKPYEKEFLVKLNKPLKLNQKGRSLKLEYDWDEPDRNFVYKLSSECKKFTFLLTLPNDVELKNLRVLRVDPETGYKTHATPSANIKYLKKRTEMRWQATNLHAYDAYRFEW